jgi:glucose-6-phosphate 1-dehydrogenase
MIHLLSPFATNIHNILIYLAIPPNIFTTATLTIRNTLRQINTIPFDNVRIILEKPFGHDTLSCQLLLQELQQQQWNESSMYRIDHYLGKHAVRNIITIRQYLEKQHSTYSWNNMNHNTVQSVHILLKETFGIEQRGGYYDAYGVIRDVIQNHLLQILTLLIMKIPLHTTAESIRDSKVHVLQSIETVQMHDCLFGQYDGYVNDPSIQDKNSKTPTYACIRLLVNHHLPNWMGVPLYLEAGKALDDGICEIRINMKQSNTTFVLQIQPLPSIGLEYNNIRVPISSLTKDCQQSLSMANEIFQAIDHTSSLGAYTTLIVDALHGQSTNFVRNDELLEAWRIFTPILHEYERNNRIQPISYPCGSSGPVGRLEFVQQGHVVNQNSNLRSSL